MRGEAGGGALCTRGAGRSRECSPACHEVHCKACHGRCRQGAPPGIEPGAALAHGEDGGHHAPARSVRAHGPDNEDAPAARHARQVEQIARARGQAAGRGEVEVADGLGVDRVVEADRGAGAHQDRHHLLVDPLAAPAFPRAASVCRAGTPKEWWPSSTSSGQRDNSWTSAQAVCRGLRPVRWPLCRSSGPHAPPASGRAPTICPAAFQQWGPRDGFRRPMKWRVLPKCGLHRLKRKQKRSVSRKPGRQKKVFA